MIPLEYRLSGRARLEPAAGGAWHVVSEAPLAVVTVNEAAAAVLEMTRNGSSVAEIAATLHTAEERIFTLCERMRSCGFLQVGRAAADRDFGPSVTAIVPTRDRAGDLDACLGALACLDYPSHLLDVIVVDDGSADPAAVEEVVDRHHGRLLTNEGNQGPSFSRNRATREATGEILAFIDSDCVAGSNWLRELTPYFSWDRVGAVGGRTTGYSTGLRLDRYEEVASPLDMGTRPVWETRGRGTFYLPTCNLLVRRSLYLTLGGLREDLRVGEDVDLCWRLRASGAYLVYAPAGIVRHKHRNRLGAMVRRRAEYGSSEARLHQLHPEKRKSFPLAPAPLATLVILSAAMIALEPRLLAVSLAPPLLDWVHRVARLRRVGVEVPGRRVGSSVIRSHLSVVYSTFFHLVRYYLLLLAAAGLIVPGLWLLAAVAVLYTAAVDYFSRRPRIGRLTFLGFFLAEHLAYQSGVVAGCVRCRTLRSYLPAFRRDHLQARMRGNKKPPPSSIAEEGGGPSSVANRVTLPAAQAASRSPVIG